MSRHLQSWLAAPPASPEPIAGTTNARGGATMRGAAAAPADTCSTSDHHLSTASLRTVAFFCDRSLLCSRRVFNRLSFPLHEPLILCSSWGLKCLTVGLMSSDGLQKICIGRTRSNGSNCRATLLRLQCNFRKPPAMLFKNAIIDIVWLQRLR